MLSNIFWSFLIDVDLHRDFCWKVLKPFSYKTFVEAYKERTLSKDSKVQVKSKISLLRKSNRPIVHFLVTKCFLKFLPLRDKFASYFSLNPEVRYSNNNRPFYKLRSLIYDYWFNHILFINTIHSSNFFL